MLIAINTRLLISGKLEGLGRFTHETLRRITQSHPEHRFLFIFDRPFCQDFIYGSNVIPVVAFPPARHPLLWYLFFDWGIPRVLRKYKPDLFLSPDGWLSLRTEIPQIAVIHDLNFLHNPQWVEPLSRCYYRHFFFRFIRKAAQLVTVSEFTRSDISSRFSIPKENIELACNGCSSGFVPLTEQQKQETRTVYSNSEDYYLVLGLVHPRKNLVRVIQAFSVFKQISGANVKLLVVGSLRYMTREVQKVLKESQFVNDIVFTGRMNDLELQRIMASTIGLVYASLFEGFGIPILEAMHCEVPVIASNTSSMPEVGGEAVLYVDPYSVNSIAAGMNQLFCNNELRKELIDKSRNQRERFNWEKSAEALWYAIEQASKKIPAL